MPSEHRVLVVGGGIGGLSAASFLAEVEGVEVVVVEAESALAHHTTGRSAAQLIFNYGTPPLRALTRAGVGFFRDTPDGLVDAPLLHTRAELTVATTPEQLAVLDRLAADADRDGVRLDRLDSSSAVAEAPLLRPESVLSAVLEPDSADIDVAGLHQAFVRNLRRRGGEIRTDAALVSGRRSGAGWSVSLDDGTDLAVDSIVDTAGAWGDTVAERCGVAPIGLTPMRRTAFMVRSPFDGSAGWPLVADADHAWYCKPDGRQFLCSPADETPEAPTDSKPDELDVALAIDRINTHTTLGIRSVASAWAGQRTFTPDRTMAIGPDADEPRFLWCVGQGGTGIQSAPAAGALVAHLTTGSPDAWTAASVEPLDDATIAALDPARFR
ncbi:MAG: NAD(P)/FAD-dependent oxidoreductase [Acidimicrobiales bacterium]